MVRAKAKLPEEMSVRVVVRTPGDLPVYYINFIEVAHSINEFGLFAVRMPVKPTLEQLEECRQTGELRVDPELHLVLPPTVIPGLIRALTTQQAAYERRFGAILVDERGGQDGQA